MWGICFFRYMLMRTSVRYLFFQFSVYEVFYCGGKFSAENFPFPCCIFTVGENCHWFCNIWFFAIKTHPLASASHQRKLSSSVIMECYLNILEPPQQQQEQTFDEAKIRFINLKISIWDFFGVLQATYLGYTNEEKSRMFKEYYSKLVNKYYGRGKLLVCFFWLVWQTFWCVFLNICSDIFGSFLRKSTSFYSNWQWYLSGY